ncbi:hypothetical protein CC1G_06795 [Coprinopsis cinerea okayama7|uniref:Uncharacterized protein n=1 Tax=Coprinopsis cinerea (strain Okayama-7 / 130 / ATCC MYA-4618 / FGSC 9003) TaxID=240176 RepID=A8N1R7_COPC7|nr:hypothetical protein CC1G_06795 [Coprinopsis cinerea okayama7\|eukprot:XP_001828809.2 hypothetical protein CC1G_06795 [Coprinopsis cinerea okayama7\
MLKALVDRPFLTFRTVHRSYHVTRTCLSSEKSSTVAKNAVEATSPKPDRPNPKKRKSRTLKVPQNPTPLPERISLPEISLLKEVRELEKIQPITIEDVERYRPADPPNPARADYEKNYKKLSQHISRSFKRDQLLKILELYDARTVVASQAKATKNSLVAMLLRQWGWTQPETSTESVVHLKANEASLVLRDTRGHNIKRLAQSRRVNLRYSRETLSLHVSGKEEHVKEVASAVTALKKDLVEKEFRLPFSSGVNGAQLDGIFLSSGAFVEKLNDTNFRISYSRSFPESATRARQNLIKIGYTNMNSIQEPLFALNSSNVSESTPLLAYPFTPVQSLFNTKDKSKVYRISRSADSPIPAPFTTPRDDQNLLDLRKWFHSIQLEHGAKVTVESFPGNRVFQKAGGQNEPPIPHCDISSQSVVQSIRSAFPRNSSFHPRLPDTVFKLSNISNQTYHRLVYSAVPSDSSTESSPPSIFRFFVVVDLTRESLLAHQYPDLFVGLKPAENGGDSTTYYALCDRGWRQGVDLLLPDSSFDVKLCVSAMQTLRLPTPFQDYIDELNARSFDNSIPGVEPPLYFYHEGQLHVLTSSEIVRSALKELPRATDEGPASRNLFTEIAVDMNSRKSESTCHASTTLDTSEESWDRFVQQLIQIANLETGAAWASLPSSP